MKEQKLILDQLDQKIIEYKNLEHVEIPPNGWIFSIRKALNMSLRQLGKRMSITSQSVWEIEDREKSGSVTIKLLRQVGQALNMRLVYGFIPNQLSLKKMIEERAMILAREIVERTSVSMELEDQKASKNRLEKAIDEKAKEIKTKIPRILWD
ncbi:MAG: mobile mystery protein A [Candidatus Marinimicrobia bacterium]|jgi:predicted DNA-binding mobile mystery protein A|nr:mobile mystery protein A [Candidatus Neomarinimicrobiota bacterium]MBT3500755.1 mobile mystery protein A [Candidatus Neomarinimicrobiota bacterium]MBT3838702.1 mobile mystery protein A [Candidatus Neomarinimicrobiota bacterium]MBT3998388.1 mobile mystery protein A [Candidatus Neomarinimicrobiota bacterium]MBT4283628.1 mobile mystery protein A [Candidatus Neomarinimicrobiota bacterium]